MSMLIKGMEMPKSCTLCELLKNDRSTFYCPVQSKEANLKANLLIELYANCPLVELLPHGDLIDKGVLKISLLGEEYGTNFPTVFNQIIKVVNSIPVVVESEE